MTEHRTRRPLSPAQAAMLLVAQSVPRSRAEMYEAGSTVASILSARAGLTDLRQRGLVAVEFASLEPKGHKGIFSATADGRRILGETLDAWRRVLDGGPLL